MSRQAEDWPGKSCKTKKKKKRQEKKHHIEKGKLSKNARSWGGIKIKHIALFSSDLGAQSDVLWRALCRPPAEYFIRSVSCSAAFTGIVINFT